MKELCYTLYRTCTSCWRPNSLWRADSHLAVLYVSNCNLLQVISLRRKPIQSKSVLCLSILRTDTCSLNIIWSDERHSQMCRALLPLQIYPRSFMGITGQTDLCKGVIFTHIYKAEMNCTLKCLCPSNDSKGCADY